MSGIVLLIAQVEKKTAKDYRFVDEGRPGNPTLHELNYAIKDIIRVDQNSFSRFQAKDAGEVEKLRQRLKARGLSGKFMVQHPLGGPGKRRLLESKTEWLGKRKSGMQKLVEFEV